MGEEKQEEIKAKWAERAEEEGRNEVGGDETFKGTVVWRCRGCGWIAPDDPDILPAEVLESVKTMMEELRGKAEENGRKKDDRYEKDVLYFRICDRSDIETKLDKGDEVQFKVYVDSKGAG